MNTVGHEGCGERGRCFACETFLVTWRRERPAVAYGHIHERDRFRCQNI